MPEAIKHRESTYTSATDIYGSEIFTDKNENLNKQYLEIKKSEEDQQNKALFKSAKNYENLSEDYYNSLSASLAKKYNLFEKPQDENFFKTNTNDYSIISTVVIIIIFVILSVLAVCISYKWHRRKNKSV